MFPVSHTEQHLQFNGSHLVFFSSLTIKHPPLLTPKSLNAALNALPYAKTPTAFLVTWRIPSRGEKQ